MFSKEQIERALALYHESGSIGKTIQELGYPTRRSLYHWIEKEGKERPPRKPYRNINTPDHPRNPSIEVKIQAIHRCFEEGESIKSVAEEIGYTRSSIYTWRRRYARGGLTALMNEKNIVLGSVSDSNGDKKASPTVEELQAQMKDMQLEIDILKETLNVLKKDPGVNMEALKNREKAVIVDALRGKYSLPLLLAKLEFSKSSYYYQEACLNQPDKYSDIRIRIKTIFTENKCCYGYRRIHAILQRENVALSEKIVRRIMKEEQLQVKIKRRRKYSSYQGEISPAVPDIIQRDFHSEKPNEKWLTDITEFAIPAGKIYLSPIVDCFDGMLPAWTIGTSPDSRLVNEMLDKAVSTLEENEHPLVHSDRGCHYRWPGWIERMEKAGLTRSMSKKGCSPDNSACEGLFGRIKNEMFYCRDWSNVSIREFKAILNEYLFWYNEGRIKVSLGNMSPMEYRHNLGLAL